MTIFNREQLKKSVFIPRGIGLYLMQIYINHFTATILTLNYHFIILVMLNKTYLWHVGEWILLLLPTQHTHSICTHFKVL